MANFYTEHPELKFHLNNPLMERRTMLMQSIHMIKCLK